MSSCSRLSVGVTTKRISDRVSLMTDCFLNILQGSHTPFNSQRNRRKLHMLDGSNSASFSLPSWQRSFSPYGLCAPYGQDVLCLHQCHCAQPPLCCLWQCQGNYR